MTCCHEVISARHMDYIFLQFNAEMNQIVYRPILGDIA